MAQVLFMNMELECAFRLCAAFVCGALIGLERAIRHKGAGLRTHIIVAIGAALFVIVSKYGFVDVVSQEGVQVDVARVASNVVTGVGFLGAGIISLKGDGIHGLTTAAGVWVTAAIGLAMGAGLYILGIAGTILICGVQLLLHLGHGYGIGLEKLVTSSIVVNMEADPKVFHEFLELMKQKGIKVSGNHIKRHKDMTLTYTLDVHMPRSLTSEDILAIVKECDYVKSIEM